VCIFSNSAGSSDDKDFLEAERISRGLRVHVIRHVEKVLMSERNGRRRNEEMLCVDEGGKENIRNASLFIYKKFVCLRFVANKINLARNSSRLLQIMVYQIFFE
jgi:hypothetical protein